MAKPPTRGPIRPAERPAVRSRKAFIWATEIFITALGVIAVAGPEEAEGLVTKVLGVIVMVVAFLGLFVGLLSPAGARRKSPIFAWALIAFATGAVVQWVPYRGVASLGTLVGLLLVGHGLTATSVAVRNWRTSGLARTGFGLAAILLLLVGLVFVFGKSAGDRVAEILVGIDIVLFGASLIVGRLLIEARSRSSGATGGRSPRAAV
jgi:uncharacterized membrane protein HdeD (DUF308 family)